MTVTFGFYNSLNHDRVYNATDFSKIFDGVINDGIFMSVGDHLAVTPNGGMNVAVGTGRAWFNGTWTNNDSPIILTLDNSSPTLNRIDLIVLEINSGEEFRTNSFKIIKGTAASVPSEPSLGNTTERFSYVLASVYITKGTTVITTGNIFNRIGTANTPFVTGILDTVSVDGLLTQWEAQFLDWFENLQDELDANQATNLQNQINTIEADNWVTTPRIADNSITIAKIVNQTRRVIFPAGGHQYSGSSPSGQSHFLGMEVCKTSTRFEAASFQGMIPLDYVGDGKVYLAIGNTLGDLPVYTYRVRVMMHKGIGDIMGSELDITYNWSFNHVLDYSNAKSYISPAIILPNPQPGWFVSGVVSTHVDMTYMALRLAYLEYTADS